jgi:outer membrane protein TolC
LRSHTLWISKGITVNRSGLLVGFLVLMVMPWLGGSQPRAAEPAGKSQDPAEKIRDAVRGAWQSGAGFAETLARIEAERSSTRVQARAGPPYVEYQQEGIDSSFGNAPNAAKYVRLGKPFNVPWQWHAGKSLISATETYADTARQTAAMNAALEAGQAWIRLAFLEEQVAVQERLLDRKRKALELHRKRFEMGEVSGSEVTQVELEYVAERTDLTVLRTSREKARFALERLAGQGNFRPARGDLGRLAEGMHPLPAGDAWVAEALERSLFVKLAHQRTIQGRRSADLEQGLAWGRPEIEVEWEHVPSVEGLEGFDAFGWRLQVPLPVDRSGWERRKASRANLAAAEAQERILRKELTARIRAASAAAAAAEERLEALEELIAGLPDTERSLTEQFRLGTISYLVYFDALSRLDGVVIQYIETRRGLLEARLELAVVLYDLSLFPLPDPSVEDYR